MEGSRQRGQVPSLWGTGPFLLWEPFPPRRDAVRNHPGPRCEAPAAARTAAGSAAARRALPAPLSPEQKHEMVGKETGERCRSCHFSPVPHRAGGGSPGSRERETLRVAPGGKPLGTLFQIESCVYIHMYVYIHLYIHRSCLSCLQVPHCQGPKHATLSS